jgi:hypothetical protein
MKVHSQQEDTIPGASPDLSSSGARLHRSTRFVATGRREDAIEFRDASPKELLDQRARLAQEAGVARDSGYPGLD